MKYLLLTIHLSSAAMTVVYIIITLLQTLRRSGNVTSNRRWAVGTSLAVVASGLSLTLFSVRSLGLFCLQASGIIIAVVVCHLLLLRRAMPTKQLT